MSRTQNLNVARVAKRVHILETQCFCHNVSSFWRPQKVDPGNGTPRLFNGTENYTIYTKDAFHRHIIQGEDGAVNPKKKGTKVAPYYVVSVPAGGECTLRCRLMAEDEITMPPFSEKNFDDVLQRRRAEADQFYSIALQIVQVSSVTPSSEL